MTGFELVDRDGLARLGQFDTPHGRIHTPALLPVVHPDLARQPIPPEAMRQRFGVEAIITSAYIAWRSPALRETAEREGIRALVRFPGPVMTDSGAFQQHAYGHVEVGPGEILDFQNRIGSDIATVLDRFIEPDSPAAAVRAGVEETRERARSAREHRDGLLAVPVQGGLDRILRRASAEAASELGDVAAVGGVVPLMEQYRFADLVQVLHAVRPGVAPGRPVHLFGTGHPILFALAALFGVDLFDSSAYHKFARRDDLLFPEGTVPLGRVREPICSCRLCEECPIPLLQDRPREERERRIAEHNLLMSLQEIRRVRQAIRDGTLWELVEQRAHGHPALLAALDATLREPDTFVPTEPVSRRSFRVLGPESLRRPSVVAFHRRTDPFRRESRRTLPGGRPALIPARLARIPTMDSTGAPIGWECSTPLGPVPIELAELYPAGTAVGPEEFAAKQELWSPAKASEPMPGSGSLDYTEEWTRRHVRAILQWAFGAEAARLADEGLSARRSPRTGRLRGLIWSGSPAFAVGNDGLPIPGWLGAELLHQRLPAPASRVGVASDAVEFVAEGRSLFARFAEARDRDVRPGASVLCVDRLDRLLAVGRLLLAPHEFSSFSRGVAVRVTSHARHRAPPGEASEVDELKSLGPG